MKTDFYILRAVLYFSVIFHVVVLYGFVQIVLFYHSEKFAIVQKVLFFGRKNPKRNRLIIGFVLFRYFSCCVSFSV